MRLLFSSLLHLRFDARGSADTRAIAWAFYTFSRYGGALSRERGEDPRFESIAER